MRIISMHILKWEDEKSQFIASVYELGFARFEYFLIQLVSTPLLKGNS